MNDDPAAAEEIARLTSLMQEGEECRGDFLRLCQLLVNVGSADDAEYLLRRNLDFYEGRSLYQNLFGAAKEEEFTAAVEEEEFTAAVEAFQSQFDLRLEVVAENDFLETTFKTEGGSERTDEFQLLSFACEVSIGYIMRHEIEANIVRCSDRTVVQPHECLFLKFHNGVWEIADPGEA